MKFRYRVIGLLTTIVICLSIAVYYRTYSLSVEEKNKPLKIGVIMYRGDDIFISSIGKNIEGISKKLEKKLNQQFSLKIVDSRNNQTIQNTQVDNFIKNDYDAICINMVDRTVSAIIIDKAKKANIPVIFFNREPVEEDLYKWKDAYYVGSDARESGKLQGEIVAEAYGVLGDSMDTNSDGKIQYIMLEGEEAHQDSLIRTESAVSTIVGSGIKLEKLASASGSWMRGNAYDLVSGLYKHYGDEIELVISNNDEMAIGAVQAIEESGGLNKLPVIVGIDGTRYGIEAVESGKLIGTIINDSKRQAEAMLRLCYAACNEVTPNKIEKKLEGRYVWVEYKKKINLK